MQKTVAEIADYLGGRVLGNADELISGVNSIQEAENGQITFVSNSKYIPLARTTRASAIIAPDDLELDVDAVVIVCSNPSYAFSQALSLFVGKDIAPQVGIHPTAVISDHAELAADVSVGPHVVIEAGVKISQGTRLHAGCFVGQKSSIGKDCEIFPNVSILAGTLIANRVRIHSGTVIGSDGFGYEFIDGEHKKIPQIGIVQIEDDVEIGANVSIDRARFNKTFIGRGTKIDNLVQIAHNVHIGEDCIIIAQVGISGSVVVEKNVIIAGQSGVAGHLTIGAGSIVAGQSGVSKSIPPGTKVWGYPAKEHHAAKRIHAKLQALPEYVKIINELKKDIIELKKRVGDS